MAKPIPLGKQEHQHLEFKGRDALRDPATIGREVVSMLNADGGEVWVGIREDRGVAVEVEGIDDPGRAARVLFDYLIETIEPPPRDEVRIVEVREATGRVALRIDVKPAGRRRPYAYVRRGGRHFVIRVGDRVRPLAREELFPERVESYAAQAWGQMRNALEKELESARADRTPRLWLSLQPVKARIELDRSILRYFTDYAETGNRRTGWTFVDPHEQPELRRGRIIYGRSNYRRTELRDDGGIRFTVPLDHLYWKGDANTLWPYPLIEYPVSVFRLASKVYGSFSTPDDDRVGVQLALVGAEGWKLKAGSPNTVQWVVQGPKAFRGKDIVTRLLEQRWRDIVEYPDRGAYPLIKAVYEEFGFFGDDIAPEFDPVAGLNLPS